MAYKHSICGVFHSFCKIARFFATEPNILHFNINYNLFLSISYEVIKEIIIRQRNENYANNRAWVHWYRLNFGMVDR